MDPQALESLKNWVYTHLAQHDWTAQDIAQIYLGDLLAYMNELGVHAEHMEPAMASLQVRLAADNWCVGVSNTHLLVGYGPTCNN